MKLSEAIEEFDALVPNSVDNALKVRWISDLDLQVNRELLLPRRIGRPCFRGYGQEADMDAELLIPAGYTEIYRHYMAAQYYSAMQEDGNFNREANQYNVKYKTYADWVAREHMCRPTRLKLV